MSKTNIVVLNSDQHTSTQAFDHLSSLVSFVGLFVDAHNGWSRHCELIVVHRNNQVVRNRFRTLGDLVEFTQGIQVAGWLMTCEGSVPDLNYMSWLHEDDEGKGSAHDVLTSWKGKDNDPEPVPDKDAEPNEYGEYPV